MTKIKTETAYNAIIERIKELNSLVNDDTPITHKKKRQNNRQKRKR